MKKINLILICITLLTFTCETEDESDTKTPDSYDLTVTIYNAEDWSVVNMQPLCSGATVKLINSSGTLTETTNANGQAVFEDFPLDISTIEVTKNNLSNIVDKNSLGKGFVGIGIFQSEVDVISYSDALGNPIQPNAQPGDLKLYDANWDNKINDRDRVSAAFYYPYKDVNGDLLIDHYDKVDGEFVVKDDIDMEVFIGL